MLMVMKHRPDITELGCETLSSVNRSTLRQGNPLMPFHESRCQKSSSELVLGHKTAHLQ